MVHEKMVNHERGESFWKNRSEGGYPVGVGNESMADSWSSKSYFELTSREVGAGPGDGYWFRLG